MLELAFLYPGGNPVEDELIDSKSRDAIHRECARVFGIEPDTVEDGNIGFGADWSVVIASFSKLFFIGKSINENLDAWLDLSRKLKRFKNARIARFDDNGLKALLLGFADNHIVGGINNSFQYGFILIRGDSPILSPAYKIEESPELICILAVHNQEKGHLYSAKSDGTITYLGDLPSLFHWEYGIVSNNMVK